MPSMTTRSLTRCYGIKQDWFSMLSIYQSENLGYVVSFAWNIWFLLLYYIPATDHRYVCYAHIIVQNKMAIACKLFASLNTSDQTCTSMVRMCSNLWFFVSIFFTSKGKHVILRLFKNCLLGSPKQYDTRNIPSSSTVQSSWAKLVR